MSDVLLFVILIFCSVFLLSFLLIVPTFGVDRSIRKRLSKQIQRIRNSSNAEEIISLTRKKYLQNLSPFERKLEAIPFVARLAILIEQCGYEYRAYRVALFCVVLALVAALTIWLVTFNLLMALAIGFVVMFIPVLKLIYDRNSRMDKFNEQLPEALDVMVRALKAGYPFSQTLHLVSEEMSDPIASEFHLTAAEMSYGYDAKDALLNLLERMPNVSVMAVVTSVMIQNETGGNLAEVLTKISNVIRSRFKLMRKVKTLSAEGRLSAWILTLVPFILAIVLYFIHPGYLPILFDEEIGKNMLIGMLIAMFIGVLWMRKIIRIDI